MITRAHLQSVSILEHNCFYIRNSSTDHLGEEINKRSSNCMSRHVSPQTAAIFQQHVSIVFFQARQTRLMPFYLSQIFLDVTLFPLFSSHDFANRVRLFPSYITGQFPWNLCLFENWIAYFDCSW